MPFVLIDSSPLLPDTSPVRIHYRETGCGRPLVFLHGGWGYQIYPFERQIEALSKDFRIIIPDRSGYGRSMRLRHMPTDFHRRAAAETLSLLDALELERPVLWGHSDGAVIAALIGLSAPSRVSGLILEAFHFLRNKPGSRGFFETMAANPDLLGDRVTRILSADHGEDYWRFLIVANGEAWLGIADESAHMRGDLYDGKLNGLSAPTIFIHGSRDPRTEPGELDALARVVGRERIILIEGGGHSPHSESTSADQTNLAAEGFLRHLFQSS